ncbi:hypothetical protein M9458_045767, partial [Cirrhinus mrigala]
FRLIRHTVGLVYRGYVVHQCDGLHRLMYSTADGLPHFGGARCTRRLQVLRRL